MVTNTRRGGQGLNRKVIQGTQSVRAPTSRSVIVLKNVCFALSERTASAAKRSQHCPHTLGRRGQLRRRPCPPSSILLSTRWHQLTNENSFQAAIAYAFPQPSAAWEPEGKVNIVFHDIQLKNIWFSTHRHGVGKGHLFCSVNMVWWGCIFF